MNPFVIGLGKATFQVYFLLLSFCKSIRFWLKIISDNCLLSQDAKVKMLGLTTAKTGIRLMLRKSIYIICVLLFVIEKLLIIEDGEFLE